MPKPNKTKSEYADLIVKTIDNLVIARAGQRLAEFIEDSRVSAKCAELAAESKQLLKELLEKKL